MVAHHLHDLGKVVFLANMVLKRIMASPKKND